MHLTKEVTHQTWPESRIVAQMAQLARQAAVYTTHKARGFCLDVLWLWLFFLVCNVKGAGGGRFHFNFYFKDRCL